MVEEPKKDAYASKLVRSKRIRHASLHVRKAWKRRLYAVPFFLAYGLWLVTVIGGSIFSETFWNELWLVPLVLLALGHFLTFMACHWSVKAEAWITCYKVDRVSEAELVHIVPREHGGVAALVPLCHQQEGGEKVYFFLFQRQKFIYNSERHMFHKLHYPEDLALREYFEAGGLTAAKAKEAEGQFGRNLFDLPLPTFWELFQEHAVAPFFVFQVFCVGLWCLDEYWYYSVFTLFMLVVFESTVVQQRLRNMREFRTMALPTIKVKVRRDGKWLLMTSEELIPGDLVLLEYTSDATEFTIPCDMLLLKGTCIANEAMISGESTPLLKEGLLETRQVQEEGETALDLCTDRNHILFGGTKLLQIVPPATNTTTTPKGPSIVSFSLPEESTRNGAFCVAFVLRTGFGTMQGKLVRTMLYSSERMTANNLEAFAFILFLLIFALAAASYVLYHGWADEARSRFKLLLECALIITAVVPPELPMELSLAVNNSLIALARFAIFCMEPFRIPLAGKLDVCCFDKTGTLTGESLVVKGIAGLDLIGDGEGREFSSLVAKAEGLPTMTMAVLSTCHSLFRVSSGGSGKDQQIVGDPMEKTTLDFVGWTIVNGDELAAVNGPKYTARILHRFPFSSALKRMACLVQWRDASSGKRELLVTCKGAPEVLEERLVRVPPSYRATFSKLAHGGARVLTLAYKSLPGNINPERAKHYLRADAERDLIFAGFLVFYCPLKADSKNAIKSLQSSLHHIVMITGDNALTAIYTAFELEMAKRPVILLEASDNSTFKIEVFSNTDSSISPLDNLDISALSSPAIREQYDFAITGSALDLLLERDAALFGEILPLIAIFARASPSQKEFILTAYKTRGYTTLMCGDGTNDVGALKQAHVGVALLDGKPEDLSKILSQMQTAAMKRRQVEMEKTRLRFEQKYGMAAHGNPEQARQAQIALQRRIDGMLENLDQDEVPMVRLGDASVAAPFTSKLSTIEAVCNIVRQGRCALVTTMQMYKILALNSLISAYGLSVLHLEGVRYGDFQVTVTGMLLAGCFLFLSRAQPIQQLAPQRPQPTIFNWYVLLSVLLQFLLHVAVLYVILGSALRYSFRIRVDENTTFRPGLVNTAIFIVSLLMQVSTFVVNYQGRPFRESLWENRPLRNCLLIVSMIAITAATEYYPSFNEWLQLVPMPPMFRSRLLMAMFVDFVGCILIEKCCYLLLFNAKPRIRN